MTVLNDALGPGALDFWLGDWDLTWGDTGRGTNHIERALGGRVIKETFEGSGPRGTLHGMSLSVREDGEGPWHQAWVDSTGGYLDLQAIEVDGRIAFQRTTVEGGVRVMHRMVWLEVTGDSLRWEWQQSEDAGQTWTATWVIAYRRR